METPEQAADRARLDLALLSILSDTGLRRSEAVALRWPLPPPPWGPGHYTAGGAGGEAKVFGLSEYQVTRRVKAIARAAGLADWELFSGHIGRADMARRMAQNRAPTHEIERQGRRKQSGGMVHLYTRGESTGSALRYL